MIFTCSGYGSLMWHYSIVFYGTVKTALQPMMLSLTPNNTNPNPNYNAILNSSNTQTQTTRPETELHRQNSTDNYVKLLMVL